MNRAKRLEKLETPLTQRWHETWEHYTAHLTAHLDALIDPLQTAAKEVEAQGLFKEEGTLDAAAEAFCKRIGVPSPFTLASWDARADIPDLDTPPDLNRWPRNLPEPPPEPSGVWEKLEPFQNSPDLNERLPALLYLFYLAHARARREYVAQIAESFR